VPPALRSRWKGWAAQRKAQTLVERTSDMIFVIIMRLLQKFPKSENRRGILPRNILKINDLSGKMPDLFAAKFDFCKSLL
jgi:hypothetical protein